MAEQKPLVDRLGLETSKALIETLKQDSAQMLHVMKANHGTSWKEGLAGKSFGDVRRKAQETILKANGKAIMNRMDKLRASLNDASMHAVLALGDIDGIRKVLPVAQEQLLLAEVVVFEIKSLQLLAGPPGLKRQQGVTELKKSLTAGILQHVHACILSELGVKASSTAGS